MTALVADKVAFWLADHPGSTVEEIARGIHHRDIAVREVLQSPLFVFGDRGGRKVYSLRSSVGDGLGRAQTPHRETDCDFLLRVLSDGEKHCLNEILRRSMLERGCGITIHSRASDLRARGHNIVNWRDGDRGNGSWYQLRHDIRDQMERFMAFVAVDEATGCWNWTGFVTGRYGSFQVTTQRSMRAHRWLYEQHNGAIPDDLQLDHLCRNKLCVNPGHLEAVTASENKLRDYDAQHLCRNGLHEKSAENTYVNKQGHRLCRPCLVATRKKAKANMRERERLVPSETSGVSPEDGAAATSGGTAAPESATLGVSLDTTGQLTLTGESFRKRQRAA